MRVIEFKIPTRHNMWKVRIIEYYTWSDVAFSINGYRIDHNVVPKSIRKRARCFFADPNRFGKVRFI